MEVLCTRSGYNFHQSVGLKGEKHTIESYLPQY